MKLTLSQTTNFRLFKTEDGRKFCRRVENVVRKGEIARNERFLLFPQFFQKTCNADR